MDPQSNSSFIPRQSKKVSTTKNRRSISFPLLTVLAHALFVGAMLAATVVFIYNQFTAKQLQQSVLMLEQAVSSFQVTDLQSVFDFDERIKNAKLLLDHHASINKALSVIEELTVSPLVVQKVVFERVDQTTLRATLSASASEFDFVIFQRDIIEVQSHNSILNSRVFNVNYRPLDINDVFSSKQVNFDIEIDFNTPLLQPDFVNFVGNNINTSPDLPFFDNETDINDEDDIFNQDDFISNDLEE